MGLIRTLERRASPENPSTNLSNPDAWLWDALGARSAASGVRVTPEGSLGLPAVMAAVRAISETIASLPLLTYRRLSNGGKERAASHPMYRILHDRPNPEMSSFVFREAMQNLCLLWGSAFAEIERDQADRPRHLWPIHPNRVQVIRRNGRKLYLVEVDGRWVPVSADQMLHINGPSLDGLRGFVPIQLAKEGVGLAHATEEFGARYFGNGSQASVALKHPARLSDDAYERLKQDWEAKRTGLSNAHRAVILEEGMEAQFLSIPNEHAQFLETRKFQATEIARMFRVPPHLIGDLERSTFSNIEHQGIEFVVHTIRPWAVRWEQEMNWALFDAPGHFVEFLIDGLLRGDKLSRAQALAVERQNGVINGDEWREIENMNPIPDGSGKAYLVNGNMIAVERAVNPPEPPAPSLPPGAPPAPEPDPEGAEPARLAPPPTERRAALEKRAVGNRRRLRRSHERLFQRAGEAVVKREADMVRSALKKAQRTAEHDAKQAIGHRRELTPAEQVEARAVAIGRLREMLEELFREHGGFVADQFLEILRAYARTVAAEAASEADGEIPEELDEWIEGYADVLGERWSGSSSGQLGALIDETEVDEVEDAILQRLTEWEEARAGKVAAREVVESGEAVTQLVYLAAGVQTLRWAASGENCPLCDELDGRVVGILDYFVPEGGTVDPGGDTAPLTSKMNIGHPPLHMGCDCAILIG